MDNEESRINQTLINKLRVLFVAQRSNLYNPPIHIYIYMYVYRCVDVCSHAKGIIVIFHDFITFLLQFSFRLLALRIMAYR